MEEEEEEEEELEPQTVDRRFLEVKEYYSITYLKLSILQHVIAYTELAAKPCIRRGNAK